MAKALEGAYDGAVHITTDYEVRIARSAVLSFTDGAVVSDFVSSLRY